MYGVLKKSDQIHESMESSRMTSHLPIRKVHLLPVRGCRLSAHLAITLFSNSYNQYRSIVTIGPTHYLVINPGPKAAAYVATATGILLYKSTS